MNSIVIFESILGQENSTVIDNDLLTSFYFISNHNFNIGITHLSYPSSIIPSTIYSPSAISPAYQSTPKTYYYKREGLDNDWISASTSSNFQFTVQANKKIHFKTNDSIFSDPYNADEDSISGVYSFTLDSEYNDVKVKGNILNLVSGKTDPFVPGEFMRLFAGCTPLVDAKDLILPNNISRECYAEMFSGCINLTAVPSLPATELAESCYMDMFNGCTSLEYIPMNYLTATKLAKSCYEGMFAGCWDLTAATYLPATNLAPYCYQDMFLSCKIFSAPSLPATGLADGCYLNMFNECNYLTSIPALPATVLATGCYDSMFEGCSSLDSIPSNYLPAMLLANSCYAYMFHGCNSLTSVPNDLLPATALIYDCYDNMFADCNQLSTAPALPATGLADWCYHEMFKGCVNLSTIPLSNVKKLGQGSCYGMFQNCTSLPSSLPNTIFTNNLSTFTYDKNSLNSMFKGCTSLSTANNFILGSASAKIKVQAFKNMFQDCTGLKTPPQLPIITLAPSCYYGMFEGCTALTTSPALASKGENLKQDCYGRMFAGCTNLVRISASLDDWQNPINSAFYTTNWVSGVTTQNGNFYHSPELSGEELITGYNKIPIYWLNTGTYYNNFNGNANVVYEDEGDEIDEDATTLIDLTENGGITKLISKVPIEELDPNALVQVIYTGVDPETGEPVNIIKWTPVQNLIDPGNNEIENEEEYTVHTDGTKDDPIDNGDNKKYNEGFGQTGPNPPNVGGGGSGGGGGSQGSSSEFWNQKEQSQNRRQDKMTILRQKFEEGEKTVVVGPPPKSPMDLASEAAENIRVPQDSIDGGVTVTYRLATVGELFGDWDGTGVMVKFDWESRGIQPDQSIRDYKKIDPFGVVTTYKIQEIKAWWRRPGHPKEQELRESQIVSDSKGRAFDASIDLEEKGLTFALWQPQARQQGYLVIHNPRQLELLIGRGGWWNGSQKHQKMLYHNSDREITIPIHPLSFTNPAEYNGESQVIKIWNCGFGLNTIGGGLNFNRSRGPFIISGMLESLSGLKDQADFKYTNASYNPYEKYRNKGMYSGLFENFSALHAVKDMNIPPTYESSCWDHVYGDHIMPDSSFGYNLPDYYCAQMFANCSGLTDFYVNQWNIDEITNKSPGKYAFYKMFVNCTHLSTLPDWTLSLNYAKERSYASMFEGCTALSNVYLVVEPKDDDEQQQRGEKMHYVDAWTGITEKTRAFEKMFAGCTSLTNGSNGLKVYFADQARGNGVCVNEYAYMFSGCTALSVAPIVWTENSKYYNEVEIGENAFVGMFKDCTKLSTFNFAYFFHGRTALASAYLSTFAGCYNLKYDTDIEEAIDQAVDPNFNKTWDSVLNMYTAIDECVFDVGPGYPDFGSIEQISVNSNTNLYSYTSPTAPFWLIIEMMDYLPTVEDQSSNSPCCCCLRVNTVPLYQYKHYNFGNKWFIPFKKGSTVNVSYNPNVRVSHCPMMGGNIGYPNYVAYENSRQYESVPTDASQYSVPGFGWLYINTNGTNSGVSVYIASQYRPGYSLNLFNPAIGGTSGGTSFFIPLIGGSTIALDAPGVIARFAPCQGGYISYPRVEDMLMFEYSQGFSVDLSDTWTAPWDGWLALHCNYGNDVRISFNRNDYNHSLKLYSNYNGEYNGVTHLLPIKQGTNIDCWQSSNNHYSPELSTGFFAKFFSSEPAPISENGVDMSKLIAAIPEGTYYQTNSYSFRYTFQNCNKLRVPPNIIVENNAANYSFQNIMNGTANSIVAIVNSSNHSILKSYAYYKFIGDPTFPKNRMFSIVVGTKENVPSHAYLGYSSEDPISIVNI